MFVRLYEFILRHLLNIREMPLQHTKSDTLKMNIQEEVIRDIPRKYIEGLKLRDAKRGK